MKDSEASDATCFSSLPVTRFGKTGCITRPGTRSESERDLLLEELKRVCRDGHAGTSDRPAALPTGFAELDAVLPGGGWPVGAITELMPDTMGIGELSLLLPALAQLTHAGQYLAWIAPPYLPCPAALAQAGIALERLLLVRTGNTQSSLWAAEQLLRCPHIGAVLAWPAALDDRRVRRLQLAAEAGGSCGMLYRPARAAEQPSPAALRLQLHATASGLGIHIKKSRGGHIHALVVHPASAAAA
jgi:protein ImuA